MNKLKREYQFFKQQTSNVRVLLMTNLLYAFVLPVVEIFVGAYVMRHTSEPVSVAFYQLFMYIGIIATSFVNGFLLRHVSVKVLYAGELGIAGFVLGAASGFFWTNRYLLTLNNTTDNSRNYFFGLESFFFSITSITVPLLIGAFISQIDGKEIMGCLIDINGAYRLVTVGVIVVTLFAVAVLWRGKFANPIQKNFLYFRFCTLWKKMLLLASLKGMVQGFLVTAPAILILKLVGDEGTLGLIQGISGTLTAILVYVLGRIAKPEDRPKIFIAGLLVFFIGTLFNGVLFSATGVIIFVLCKVIFQPLFDLPYYPIMMQTIDAVVKIEKRNEYTYILSHEFGLFLGRAFGLILFMALAFAISQDFALKYALILVGALQLIAYPLARNIIKQNQTVR